MTGIESFPLRGGHRTAALKANIRSCVERGRSTSEIVAACEAEVPDVNLEELASLLREVGSELEQEAAALKLYDRAPRGDTPDDAAE